MFVPQPIQNQLKKEASYGCVVCGCPILVFVDFTLARNQVSQGTYIPENMVAICPFHSLKFQEGEIDVGVLSSNKNNPFNRQHEESAFTLASNELAVSLGGCTFVNTSRVLVVDDFDLINVRRANQKFVTLDVNFFDRRNDLAAIILENSWSSERSREGDWAIKYEQPKRLIIQNKREELIFEASIINNELRIMADGLRYNTQKIRITLSEVFLDDIEIGTDIKGTVLTNYDVGLRADSFASS